MKRFMSVLLVLAMVLSMGLFSAVAEEAPLVIDVYDAAANYNGIQSGGLPRSARTASTLN